MTTTTTQPSRWFFRLAAAFTLTQLVWFVLVAFDFITHPIASDAQYGSPFFRLVIALVIIPLALLISILVLRRAPGNVCGWFLIQWMTVIAGETLRPDSPLYPYSLVSVGWVGIWLLPLYFPNGRAFPSRFERLIQILSAALIVIEVIWLFFQPEIPFKDKPALNPFLSRRWLPSKR